MFSGGKIISTILCKPTEWPDKSLSHRIMQRNVHPLHFITLGLTQMSLLHITSDDPYGAHLLFDATSLRRSLCTILNSTASIFLLSQCSVILTTLASTLC